MEIEYAFLSQKPYFNYDNSVCLQYIEKHDLELEKAYLNLANRLRIQYQQEDEKHKQRIALFASKKCYCGSNLRFVPAYGFWGCSNYTDKSQEHFTYNPQYGIRKPYLDLKVHWLSDIIDECNLKGKVTAKELLKWYESLGFVDLRAKYKHGSTYQSIGGYEVAKARSIEQELQALDHLSDIYPKVLYQQCITYKLKNDKERVCIPDFICSRINEVWVIDAKLGYVDDEQMDLYVNLVRHIMSEKKDNRELQGGFIMDLTQSKPPTRYQLFHLKVD